MILNTNPAGFDREGNVLLSAGNFTSSDDKSESSIRLVTLSCSNYETISNSLEHLHFIRVDIIDLDPTLSRLSMH